VWFVSAAEFSDPDPGGRKETRASDSKNQKFNVDGQMVDAWGLKKGMKISATKVVEVPETVVAHRGK